MYALMFKQSPLLVFPLIGLCMFVSIFAVVVLHVWRRSADSFKTMAAMPLEDGQPVSPTGGVS